METREPGTVAPPTADLARWSARVGASLVILAGAVVIVLGLYFVAEDESQQGEMFDGLGTFIGLAICGIGLVCVAVAGLAFKLARRRPLVAGIILCVFGVLVAATGWISVGGSGPAVAAALILGGLVVAGLGFGAAMAAPRMAIHSRGGGYSR